MDEKLEKGKKILEFIGNNEFVFFTFYYSSLIWFMFLRKKEISYKYIEDIKKFLVDYNDLFLFVSVVSIIIVISIRITFNDHGWGIKNDGDNTIAVMQLCNAIKLEKVSGILFFIILPISFYFNTYNALKYLLFLSVSVIIVAVISKIIFIINKKISKSYI